MQEAPAKTTLKTPNRGSSHCSLSDSSICDSSICDSSICNFQTCNFHVSAMLRTRAGLIWFPPDSKKSALDSELARPASPKRGGTFVGANHYGFGTDTALI